MSPSPGAPLTAPIDDAHPPRFSLRRPCGRSARPASSGASISALAAARSPTGSSAPPSQSALAASSRCAALADELAAGVAQLPEHGHLGLALRAAAIPRCGRRADSCRGSRSGRWPGCRASAAPWRPPRRAWRRSPAACPRSARSRRPAMSRTVSSAARRAVVVERVRQRLAARRRAATAEPSARRRRPRHSSAQVTSRPSRQNAANRIRYGMRSAIRTSAIAASPRP